MVTTTPDQITDHQWQQFNEQTHLSLGPVVTDTELAGIREWIDQIMQGHAAIDYNQLMIQLDSASGY